MKKFLWVLIMMQVLFSSGCSDEKSKIEAYKNNFVMLRACAYKRISCIEVTCVHNE